jgi:hypothetical protein
MAPRAGKKRKAPIEAIRPSPPPSNPGIEDAAWLGDRIRRIALGLTAARGDDGA